MSDTEDYGVFHMSEDEEMPNDEFKRHVERDASLAKLESSIGDGGNRKSTSDKSLLTSPKGRPIPVAYIELKEEKVCYCSFIDCNTRYRCARVCRLQHFMTFLSLFTPSA